MLDACAKGLFTAVVVFHFLSHELVEEWRTFEVKDSTSRPKDPSFMHLRLSKTWAHSCPYSKRANGPRYR